MDSKFGRQRSCRCCLACGKITFSVAVITKLSLHRLKRASKRSTDFSWKTVKLLPCKALWKVLPGSARNSALRFPREAAAQSSLPSPRIITLSVPHSWLG